MAIRRTIAEFSDDIATADIADDAITGGKLANDIAISTTGAITTTGAFTSVGIDDNASGAVAITIDSSENVGIGDTDPSEAKLSISGVASGDYGMKIDQDQNNYALYIDSENTTGTAFEVSSDVVTTGKVAQFYSNSSSNSSRNLVEIGNDNVSADNAVCLYIKQDGAGPSIEFGGVGGGGILFNMGTDPDTAGTATGNILDDYEEGTWTPQFWAAANFGQNIEVGTYVKIGNFVQCQFDCGVNSTSGTSGAVELRGLPFSTKASGARSAMVIGYCDGFADTAAPQGGYLNQNAASVSMMTRSSTDGRGRMISYVQYSVFSGNERVIGHINYITA